MDRKLPTPEEMKAMEEEPMTSEEAMAKAISALTKTKFPDDLTELDEIEIRLLTRIMTTGNYFDVPLLKDAARVIIRLKISKKRKGRGEIMGVARAAKEQEDAKSKLKHFLTLGGRI